MYLLIAALLPALLLILYIRNMDRMKPEPVKMLVKGFFYGCLSAFVSLFATMFSEETPVTDIADAVITSFFDAAIPEECAKLLMLWLLVRKNKYFDEKIDGIVYSACVGMGFAGLENIFYLVSEDDWITIGILRAFSAIPGHFFYAVLMGFYFSKYWFGGRKKFWLACSLIVPIIAHGIYDALLEYIDIASTEGQLLSFSLFLFGLIMLAHRCIKLIKKTAKEEQ